MLMLQLAESPDHWATQLRRILLAPSEKPQASAQGRFDSDNDRLGPDRRACVCAAPRAGCENPDLVIGPHQFERFSLRLAIAGCRLAPADRPAFRPQRAFQAIEEVGDRHTEHSRELLEPARPRTIAASFILLRLLER